MPAKQSLTSTPPRGCEGNEPAGRPPLISAVVLTRDRPSELAAMLADLARQTMSIDRYVVVNNASDPGPTRRVLARFGAHSGAAVIQLRGQPTFGTASGRNAGLEECSDGSDGVVFLFDDDLRFPDRRYVERVCDLFAADVAGTIGAITTSAGPPDQQTSADRVSHLLRRMAKGFFGLDGLRPGSVMASGFQVGMPGRCVRDVDWLQGSVSAVRAEVARTVRFDEGLEHRPLALSEDIDFGLRVGRRWRIVFDGTTMAVNGHAARGGTARQWLSSAQRYELIVRNYDRINRTHRPGRLGRIAFWRAMAGIGLEQIFAALVSRNAEGLRGYRRGLRAVLSGSDGAPPRRRQVERLVISPGSASRRRRPGDRARRADSTAMPSPSSTLLAAMKGR